jgi:hypothetical protein
VTGGRTRADACPGWDAPVCPLLPKSRKSESAIPDQQPAPGRHYLHASAPSGGILTLLPTDIEGATSRLTAVGWPRGEAPLLHRAIRRRAFQEYGGCQPGTEGGSCVLAFTSATQVLIVAPAQQEVTKPDWSKLRSLGRRIPTKRSRAAVVQVRPPEA